MSALTKNKLKQMINFMVKEDTKTIKKLTEKALISGAFDITAFEDNFILPKIILSAIYEELIWQREPSTQEYKKAKDNIKKFI